MPITVISAVYGTKERGLIVTERVREIIDAGNDDVKVSNDNLGADPHPFVGKQFGVVYRTDDGGPLKGRCGNEGDTVDLV